MENLNNAVPYQPYRSKRHSRTASALSPEPPHTPPPLTAALPSLPVNIPPDCDLTNGVDSKTAQEVGDLAPPPDSQRISQPPPLTNGHTSSSIPPTPSSSKELLSGTTPIEEIRTKPKSAPTSTFRRVPLRTASIPDTPSPLRPSHVPKPLSHSPTTSPSFSRQSSKRRFEPQSVHDQHNRGSSDPVNHNPSRSDTVSPSLSVTAVLSPTPVPLTGINPAPAPAHIPASPALPVNTSHLLSSTASPPPSPQPFEPHSQSLTPSSSSLLRKPPAPYRPGFQPKGVYRPRTDEFITARSALRDRDKVEQRRLERRLEKLIALHFPRSSLLTPEKGKERPSTHRRASSLFDLDFRKNPTELWRDMVESRIQGAKADIRAEEQSITPWENDVAVSHCPLCATSFHPLTNRKHHCRLCGRIVCSLPVRPPTRTQTCSLLFVVDQRSGRIEEVGEGVDYGVTRRGSVKGKGGEEEDEKFLKGVRICRDCRSVLSRQRHLQEAGHVPTFARLYATLVSLEKDIEDALPQFQELILSVSSSSSSHPTSAEMRKRLLDSFGEYDRLSKRIRQLPAQRGGSQDRIQSAIMTRVTLFLQKNMFPLQALPKPQKQTIAETSSSPSHAQALDPDSQLAHALQPLLEQEALLESFIDEARAQRKFEDARTLKANLAEIRAEIDRIAQHSVR